MPSAQPDLAQLQKRLAPLGAEDLRPLAGGASSLTYAGRLGEQRVVVKVAPAGLAPTRNRDMLRQARVLRTLQGTAVPVPEVLWEDAGDPPEVPPLFVMSFIEGTSLEPLFDREGDEPETVVAERMTNAARALAALHALRPASLGLGPEPVVTLGEELDRWCKPLETVDQSLVVGWQEVATTLRAAEPGAVASAIVHGDFRLGNLLAVGTEVTAIIDWEIWAIGDPRVDLGWFLANADPKTYRRRTRYVDALPTRDELVAAYTATLGRDVPDLAWFQALACFKSTATWALIVKHNRRRAKPDESVEAMVSVLPQLLERARGLTS